jgi:hypothetical protein
MQALPPMMFGSNVIRSNMPTSARQYTIMDLRLRALRGGQLVDRVVANLVDNIPAKPVKTTQSGSRKRLKRQHGQLCNGWQA